MAVIAITGGPGAPGATTTALALLLAWPLAPGRKVLLVECDPDGGAALAGALEGRVEAVYGLRNLAVADRRGLLAQTLWDQLIDLSPKGGEDRLLLPGLTDPAQAAGLAYTWEPLVDMLHALEPQGYDVLLDLGRSGAFGPSAVLARRADVVVATVRTTMRGLSAARPRLAALREDLETGGTGADALGLLLIAEGPYPAADITREFRLPVLGLLPHAVRTARVLSDGGDSTDRRFIRSELMRTARSAVDRIQELVQRRRLRLTPATSTPTVAAAPAAWAGPGPAGADGWSSAPQAGRHPLAYPGSPVDVGYGWGAPEEARPAPNPAPGEQPYAPPSGQVYAPVAEEPYPAPSYVAPPYAGQQYTAQPYATPPYTEQACAAQAYTEQPVMGQPYAGQSYAGQPSVGQSYAGGQVAPPAGPDYGPQVQGGPDQPGPVQSGPIQPGPIRTGPVRPGPVRVAQGGPVNGAQVTPPQQPRQPAPPFADIAPHPAAPEPFRAPQDDQQTQGEVLRAR